MKNILKSFTVCLIIIAMINSTAYAAAPSNTVDPQSNSYVWKTTVGIVPLGSGKIEVDFSVTAMNKMPDVGATRVTIYNESGKSVAIYRYTDPGYGYMIGHNRVSQTASVTYQGVPGQRYYAIVTFFAGTLEGSGGGASLISTIITA